MILKAYQTKYYEVSISFLFLSNSLHLTKKLKKLRKAKFNKERQKKTRDNLSHF